MYNTSNNKNNYGLIEHDLGMKISFKLFKSKGNATLDQTATNMSY